MGYSAIDEWLIAEGMTSGRRYIVHTERPRFILEICDCEDGGYQCGETIMIDVCRDTARLAYLARRAGEIFAQYDRDRS